MQNAEAFHCGHRCALCEFMQITEQWITWRVAERKGVIGL